MKYKLLFTVFLLTAGIIIFNSCVKQDFDQPPVNIPVSPYKANFTIDSLNMMYTGTDTMLITDSIFIQGIVISSDQSGNIYKNLYIQDNTGGIVIAIDLPDLYTTYRLGQRIVIKLQGLYLGQYGGVTELGYPNGPDIGRIPEALLASHFYPDSLPGKVPAPVLIDEFTTVNMKKYLNMLVRVDNISFPDAGMPFAEYQVSVNRNIADYLGQVILVDGQSGNEFILRTSGYALFYSDLLPFGVGNMTGILSQYSGQFQMYIRDLNDLANFDTTVKVIYRNDFSSDPPDWVIETLTSNKPWTWDSQYLCMSANGYGGTAPCETWLISPAIDLTGVTDPVLTFNTWTKYTDSAIPHPLEVKISTDYSGSGNPSSATWTDLPCTLATTADMTPSGPVSLSDYHQKVYIAYRYRSSGTGSNSSSKWEVDDFSIRGKKYPSGNSFQAASFRGGFFLFR